MSVISCSRRLYTLRSQCEHPLTIFLPHMRSSIQTGSSPSVNPAADLAFPGANRAARRVPVIAQQSAGLHIQAV